MTKILNIVPVFLQVQSIHTNTGQILGTFSDLNSIIPYYMYYNFPNTIQLISIYYLYVFYLKLYYLEKNYRTTRKNVIGDEKVEFRC